MIYAFATSLERSTLRHRNHFPVNLLNFDLAPWSPKRDPLPVLFLYTYVQNGVGHERAHNFQIHVREVDASNEIINSSESRK